MAETAIPPSSEAVDLQDVPDVDQDPAVGLDLGGQHALAQSRARVSVLLRTRVAMSSRLTQSAGVRAVVDLGVLRRAAALLAACGQNPSLFAG